jgi:hypothetical protein
MRLSRGTAVLFNHRCDEIMELCDECAKLQGCSADHSRASGMTLVGVDECEGEGLVARALSLRPIRCSYAPAVHGRRT